MDLETSTQGLLDRIAGAVNCPYLSDLRSPSFIEAIHKTINKIPMEDYSLNEWNDAVQYITAKTISFATVAEAWNYLKTYEL